MVAAGKVQHFAGLHGLQEVQRQIAPDGQPTAREIVHPRQTERHSVRAAVYHPRLSLKLVPAVDIGGGEGQRFSQRPGLLYPCVDLIGAEGE